MACSQQWVSIDHLMTAGDIRLIILLKSTDKDSIIKCELIQLPLAEAPPEYLALSYVWCDENDNKRILVEEEPFDVTANLYDTLRIFRGLQKHFLLWIDAIWIDQSNVPERNKQVTRMCEIYQKARITFAWRGEDGGTSDSAFERLRDWSKENSAGNDSSWVKTVSSKPHLWLESSWKSAEQLFKRACETEHGYTKNLSSRTA